MRDDNYLDLGEYAEREIVVRHAFLWFGKTRHVVIPNKKLIRKKQRASIRTAFHWLRHPVIYRRVRQQHKRDQWLERWFPIKWMPWFIDLDD